MNENGYNVEVSDDYNIYNLFANGLETTNYNFEFVNGPSGMVWNDWNKSSTDIFQSNWNNIESVYIKDVDGWHKQNKRSNIRQEIFRLIANGINKLAINFQKAGKQQRFSKLYVECIKSHNYKNVIDNSTTSVFNASQLNDNNVLNGVRDALKFNGNNNNNNNTNSTTSDDSDTFILTNTGASSNYDINGDEKECKHYISECHDTARTTIIEATKKLQERLKEIRGGIIDTIINIETGFGKCKLFAKVVGTSWCFDYKYFMLKLMIVTVDISLDTTKNCIYSKLGEKICFVQDTLPLLCPFCNDSGYSKIDLWWKQLSDECKLECWNSVKWILSCEYTSTGCEYFGQFIKLFDSNLTFDDKFRDKMKFYGWSNNRWNELCQLARKETEKDAMNTPTLLTNDDDATGKPCFEIDFFDIGSDDDVSMANVMFEKLRSELNEERQQFANTMTNLKNVSLMRNLKLIAVACHKIHAKSLGYSGNCNRANGINNEFEAINRELKRTLDDIINININKDDKLHSHNDNNFWVLIETRGVAPSKNNKNPHCSIVFVLLKSDGYGS